MIDSTSSWFIILSSHHTRYPVQDHHLHLESQFDETSYTVLTSNRPPTLTLLLPLSNSNPSTPSSTRGKTKPQRRKHVPCIQLHLKSLHNLILLLLIILLLLLLLVPKLILPKLLIIPFQLHLQFQLQYQFHIKLEPQPQPQPQRPIHNAALHGTNALERPRRHDDAAHARGDGAAYTRRRDAGLLPLGLGSRWFFLWLCLWVWGRRPFTGDGAW